MQQIKRQFRELIHPLESLRREMKLTQTQVASRTGLSNTIIGRFERGLQIPTHEESKMLGMFFGLQWHQVIELCVDYRIKRDRLLSRLKMSESSTYSTVCTNQEIEKCGAR